MNTEDAAKTRPWLLVGKGPSFCQFPQTDVNEYNVVALNHTIREVQATLAHIIDIEVVRDCAEAIRQNASYLIMPWIPHVRKKTVWTKTGIKFEPGPYNLENYCQTEPILAELNQQGRLLWYNLSTAKVYRAGSPVVKVFGFSSTAMLECLAIAGASKVRSIGIDGGSSYSNSFADLTKKTLLAAGQPSFNLQFPQIARTLLNHKIDFAPLGIETPIRVYVGSQPEQILAAKVLEFSIKKHTSMSVSVQCLYDALEEQRISLPTLTSSEHQNRTPFSFQRFAIPALKRYAGRAIYLDSDMLVFQDLRYLWTLPFDGADVMSVPEPKDTGRRPQFSVMLLDCEALHWDVEQILKKLDAGELSYEDLLYNMKVARNPKQTIPIGWNDLERYAEGKTHLIHYTDMHSQPWLSTSNPRAYLWCQTLFEAIDAGFLERNFVCDQVDRGWVRPSLLWQLESRVVDPLLVPSKVRRLDQAFVPPHQVKQFAKKWMSYGQPAQSRTVLLKRKLYAQARRFFQVVGAPKIIRKVRNRVYQLV